VALDSKHNLYIADYSNGRIRKIDTSGTITTFAGGGSSITDSIPATSLYLSQPYDVIADSVDNIYISPTWERTGFAKLIRPVSPGRLLAVLDLRDLEEMGGLRLRQI
jgi:hypothetical protein